MIPTENYYDVLLAFEDQPEFEEGTELHSVREVADFIATHDHTLLTEEDGTPLLEVENREIRFCNDMQYRDALQKELRFNEGFESRNRW